MQIFQNQRLFGSWTCLPGKGRQRYGGAFQYLCHSWTVCKCLSTLILWAITIKRSIKAKKSKQFHFSFLFFFFLHIGVYQNYTINVLIQSYQGFWNSDFSGVWFCIPSLRLLFSHIIPHCRAKDSWNCKAKRVSVSCRFSRFNQTKKYASKQGQEGWTAMCCMQSEIWTNFEPS